MSLPSLEDRIRTLLLAVAENSPRPCKRCQTPIVFVKHKKSGKIAPYTLQGVNHFVDCPFSSEFQRKNS